MLNPESAMLHRLLKYCPGWLIRMLKRIQDCVQWEEFRARSWSQEGEDLILQRLFAGRTSGFYVDVGAHHPTRFSNTYIFYRMGWSGVNIDAQPGSMKLFRRLRPRDINIETGVHEVPGEMQYFVFNEPALNGFSRELSVAKDSDDTRHKIVDEIPVPVRPLGEILSELDLPAEIDFLSVDVEGLDLPVLRSNNWEKFKPEVVLAEIRNSSLDELANDPTAQYMAEQGYGIFAKTFNTVIFRRK